ncbi:hypothetical protein [Psychroserpens sp. NJDZ02]|uniref:hypothetical protein n=1 Tax=Psychroserpens sp. NJDZ02 TaxID=2570561 RepID=UPI0010A8BFDF|nr:hypothetical protein [Psychroserpens sp. NJDZ02]QCE43135.1 hypothetical protein E9099_17490 [Psychroserpens sp. NJDZ02]
MDKIINEIASQLVTFKDKPSYHASINTSACSFEFLVNDMPVLSYYNKGGIATSVPINPQILKSGIQTFTIKLYPGYYKENKQLIQADSLTKDTKFNLSFSHKDWSNLGEESKIDFEFSLPHTITESGIKEFKLAGSPYFEYEGTFNADVPYSLKGWKESVDLTQENQEDLEIEVVNAYMELRNKFQDKNIKDIIVFNKVKLIERLQSIYSSEKNDVLEVIDDYSENFDNSLFHLKPIENYKLYFFGDGKTVCLLRTDLKNKREPVIRIGYTNEKGKKRLSFYGFTFHRPVKRGPLVPIR